jgi:hypothetical protein
VGQPAPAGDNRFNRRVVWGPDGQRLAATNWDVSVSARDAPGWEPPGAERLTRP